jgi:methionyl-tRNA synthetase
MSKSLGNVINPLEFIDEFGADGLRFYLSYELPTDKDGNFSRELFIESYNAHLANNIGNLTSRVNNMITTYFDGYLGTELEDDQEIEVLRQKTVQDYRQKMDLYDISNAIRTVLDFSNAMNKYIEVQEP